MKKMKKTGRKLRKEVKLILFAIASMIIINSINVNAKESTDFSMIEVPSIDRQESLKESVTVIPEVDPNGNTVEKKPEMVSVPVEKTGIDVSQWNGIIDWQSVKDSGIDYAIIRIGYGDNIPSQDDETAIYNMAECTRLDIPFGVYIYSYATDVSMAQSEAAHVLRMIQGYKLSYPVYFDMEDRSTVSIGTDNLGTVADTFCSAINSAGYKTVIYSNTYWFNNILISPVFEKYEKWVAQYNDICEYQGSHVMWQYTSSGTVPGISGSVDMNISYETELREK